MAYTPESAAEGMAERWSRDAPTSQRPKLNLNPKALWTKRFPLKINHYDSALLDLVAELDCCSKQQAAKRTLRAACEAKLRRAGIALPGSDP